jgi:outer membrane immunogenic protein
MKNVQIKKRPCSSNSKALINTALAAIIGLGASVAQAENNWTGGFAGIDFGVGFDLGDTGELEFRRVDGSNNTAAINTAFGQNFDGEFEEGETIGLRAGYNFQSNRLVYGVVGDISYANISEEQRAFSATPATYIERRKLDTLATLRGRLGYASDLPILPYITAGLAYGDVKYSWEGNSRAFRGDNGKDGSGFGYVVGVGTDFMLTDKMTVGVEFLHYDLGDSGYKARFSGEAGGALAAFGNAASGGTIQEGSEEDFAFQTLKVNVNWKF